MRPLAEGLRSSLTCAKAHLSVPTLDDSWKRRPPVRTRHLVTMLALTLLLLAPFAAIVSAADRSKQPEGPAIRDDGSFDVESPVAMTAALPAGHMPVFLIPYMRSNAGTGTMDAVTVISM